MSRSVAKVFHEAFGIPEKPVGPRATQLAPKDPAERRALLDKAVAQAKEAVANYERALAHETAALEAVAVRVKELEWKLRHAKNQVERWSQASD